MPVWDAMHGSMACSLVFKPMSYRLTRFMRFDCSLMQPTSWLWTMVDRLKKRLHSHKLSSCATSRQLIPGSHALRMAVQMCKTVELPSMSSSMFVGFASLRKRCGCRARQIARPTLLSDSYSSCHLHPQETSPAAPGWSPLWSSSAPCDS